MKNIVIIVIVIAAIAGIVAVKKFGEDNGTSSCCPCSMMKQAETNQCETGSNTGE